MSLFQELRRRHVFKVAAGYAVVAWLLIQVANVISRPLGLPQWFEPVVLSLLLLGFPVALVLAWAFDLKPASEIAPGDTASTARSAPGLPARVATLLASVIALVTVAAGSWWYSGDQKRRARTEGIATLDELISAGNWHAAYLHARSLAGHIPGDSELANRWPKFSFETTLKSEPGGAHVFLRTYRGSNQNWESLGDAPLDNIRVPYGLSVLRAEMPGYEPVLQVIGSHLFLTEALTKEWWQSKIFVLAPEPLRLDPEGSLPDGMVRVPGWAEVVNGESVDFREYFLDRYEVTNEHYKEFVDSGGYERREYWEHRFVQNGAEIPWEDAIATFTDSTGRPGPATWIAGDFPDDEQDYPVGGINWYEAAAYARFRGKQLPSMHHWLHAYAGAALGDMVPVSNFNGTGPVPVGSTKSVSWAGNFDMSGNVREWTFNATEDRRVVLGGAWNDDPYRASDYEFSQRPMNRDAGNGLRLAIIREDANTFGTANAAVSFEGRKNFSADSIVSDEVFEAYRINFDYDPMPLNATVSELESDRLMTHELVEVEAAYPALRLPIHVYLPENASPPYQVVVYWPGSIVQELKRYEDFTFQFDFLLKSGRAVAFPIYYSSFGRQFNRPVNALVGTAADRDKNIRSIQDLRRAVDYLETRPDIDTGKIAFFGNSWGAYFGVIGLAVDDRFSTTILYTLPLSRKRLPDVDAVSYLSRLTIPTVVIGGEFDPVAPLESVVRPAFDAIGTPDNDKRLVTAPGGHSVPYDLLVRESLAWLDQYLGVPRKR